VGGLPRRATFIKEVRAQDPDAVVLDTGNFVSSNYLADPVLETAMKKAELILAAMDRMGYDAMAIGEKDLYLGLDRLRDLDGEAEVRLLSANLVDTSGKPLFDPYRIVKKGPLKVGVTGLTGAPGFMEVFNQRVPGARVRDPFETAAETVKEIRDKCDLLIVLSNIGFARDLQLAERVPGIDIIFTGGTKRFMKIPLIRRKTLITSGYYEGRAVGKLSILLEGRPKGWVSKMELDYMDKQLQAARSGTGTERGRQKYQALVEKRNSAQDLTLYEPDLVNLEPSIPDDPEVAAMIEDYRKELAAASGSALPSVSGGPAQVRYTGHQACAGCHESRHRFWLTTDHFKAFDALAPKNAGADPDCLPCHVTGYERRTGYWPKAPREDLYGVQCESCHGVGSLHASNPAGYSLVHLPSAPQCLDCHTKEQDDDFDYFRDKGKVCGEM
jgi:2',3'-cyclic-nucleotide 2'-phosphodiesterase (5'-nucleotidase family)